MTYLCTRGQMMKARFILTTKMRILLWEIAVLAYHPRWILGNRFQQWWYNKNDKLIGWLMWQLLKDMADYEKENNNDNAPQKTNDSLQGVVKLIDITAQQLEEAYKAWYKSHKCLGFPEILLITEEQDNDNL